MNAAKTPAAETPAAETLEAQVKALTARLDALEYAITREINASRFTYPPVGSPAWVAEATTEEEKVERAKHRTQLTHIYGFAKCDNYRHLKAPYLNGHLSITLNGDVVTFHESTDTAPGRGRIDEFSIKFLLRQKRASRNTLKKRLAFDLVFNSDSV